MGGGKLARARMGRSIVEQSPPRIPQRHPLARGCAPFPTQSLQDMSDHCLVRQPLFGTSGALLGYDIRFRDTEEGQDAFVQSYLSGTFDLVRGKFPAFVSCSREQLIDDAFQLADPTSAILVLPASLVVDDEVRGAVERFREKQGVIALGGLGAEPAPVEALASLAGWLRFDMRLGDLPGLELARARIEALCTGASTPRLMADHVADRAHYDQALDLAVEAFQGEFFSRPEPLPATEFPQSTVSAMRLMGLARDPKVNDRQLEEVISADPVLMFQLLRLVNSASVGLRGVSSIGQALRMIGRNSFMRWLAVAVAASRKSRNGVDAELVRQAVERGRLMEQLASPSRESGTLFLIGLFSLLDAVFRMPLADIIARVALSDDATAALLDRSGAYADALTFAESYEMGMFEYASELASDMGVDPGKLGDFYTSAISWAGETLGSVADSAPPATPTTSARPALAGRR